ncbi:MAG: tryptophan 2,3-dioxygenase family protein [Chitinophagaceae bacterium]
MHYSDYLQTEKILNAQFPESDRLNLAAHDEMLFIIIHQTYELWFKQLLYEVNSVNEIMLKPALNDNSPELQTVVHRLVRCTTILKLLVHQIDIMETMTPMDFLDFRDMLRPASGFQSVQFKMLEARLGLRFEDRYGQNYYTSQLRNSEIDNVKNAEQGISLLQLVNAWLERMPFFDEPANWKDFNVDTAILGMGEQTPAAAGITIADKQPQIHIYWEAYRNAYSNSLASKEAANLEMFDAVFFNGNTAGQLSAKACRAALFIMLYRGYPVLQLPFQLLNNLLEIDEQLSTWRYRHMSMVHRMIGMRIGTGGSTGKDYLAAALNKHYIFKDLAALTSFLIERRKLPQLPLPMEKRLGFIH